MGGLIIGHEIAMFLNLPFMFLKNILPFLKITSLLLLGTLLMPC